MGENEELKTFVMGTFSSAAALKYYVSFALLVNLGK